MAEAETETATERFEPTSRHLKFLKAFFFSDFPRTAKQSKRIIFSFPWSVEKGVETSDEFSLLFLYFSTRASERASEVDVTRILFPAEAVADTSSDTEAESHKNFLFLFWGGFLNRQNLNRQKVGMEGMGYEQS